MAAAALPSRAGAGAPPEVTSLRRQRHLEDRAYTVALVAGCLLGIGISWHAVLSDGARARLTAGLFGLTERTGVADLAVAGEPLSPCGGNFAAARASYPAARVDTRSLDAIPDACDARPRRVRPPP